MKPKAYLDHPTYAVDKTWTLTLLNSVTIPIIRQHSANGQLTLILASYGIK